MKINTLQNITMAKSSNITKFLINSIIIIYIYIYILNSKTIKYLIEKSKKQSIKQSINKFINKLIQYIKYIVKCCIFSQYFCYHSNTCNTQNTTFNNIL